ncbi:MAG TPA: carboxylesterase [Chromatiaceae bacterium]|jgi:phospholipase/carboxylesterase|nr:carboxylesterase [Chromatiaceae bacterium]HIA09110.1 carboxylesterase [Chromatiaceae bacterium]HIB85061.1 carboxylesterase [Chromatiaceae bacterium]
MSSKPSVALDPAVEIQPKGDTHASVIWLHGLGADGHDFEAIVPELDLPAAMGVHFVFPHAPVQAVTINNGMQMRSWFDIRSQDLAERQDHDGVRASEQILRDLIQQEIDAGVAPECIVLAGFSQGGAIALQTGLRFEQPLAGILALSTLLPIPAALEAEAHAANCDIAVMMAHGVHDEVIPMRLAQNSRATMEQLGYQVAWFDYPMAHQVCGPEIRDIRAWLLDVLPSSD